MSYRILMVDDNRNWLRMTTKAVSRGVNAYRNDEIVIEQADTVRLAVNKLTNERFDLLVVDLMIPGLSGSQMGGLDLIDQSLEMDRLRPIIVMTGHATVSLVRRTLTQGVFDFIEKSEETAVLIEAVRKAIDSLDQKLVRSGNPFVSMAGADPTVFGGRLGELEFFEQKVARMLGVGICEHFLVLGQWGVGKSTLLREFKQIAQSRGYLASIVALPQLEQQDNLESATRVFVEGLLRDIPYPIDRFTKVTSFFDSFGINVLGTGLEFSRDTSQRKTSPQAFLHDTLVKLWEDLQSDVDALVILLDDFENFSSVPEFAMLLKQTLSMGSLRDTKMLVGIASAPLHWMQLTSAVRHHPIGRYFLSRIELKPLSKDEMDQTIRKSLQGTGITFEPIIFERVFEFSQGHPFEMQVLCYHLFKNQVSRVVNVDVWEKALDATLEDMGVAVFNYWLDHTNEEQRGILKLLAHNQAIPLSEIKYHGLDSEQINVAIEELFDKNLIKRTRQSTYQFADRMFETYIKRFAMD